MLSHSDILKLLDDAIAEDFTETTQKRKEMWKSYVMDILPCTYGRGGENFWKKYLDRESRGMMVDLKSMFNSSDHAIALAAMETKRKEVVENREKRSERGAPPTRDRKPITVECFTAHFNVVNGKVPRIKKSWSDAFHHWATEKYGVGNETRSSSGDDSSTGENEQARPRLYDEAAFRGFLDNMRVNAGVANMRVSAGAAI